MTNAKNETGGGLKTGLPEREDVRSAGALTLDLDKYREHIEEFDLTEEQQTELLQTLFSIMKAFVDIGFGVDSIHHFLPALGANSPDAGANAVELKGHKHTHEFEEAATDYAAKDEES